MFVGALTNEYVRRLFLQGFRIKRFWRKPPHTSEEAIHHPTDLLTNSLCDKRTVNLLWRDRGVNPRSSDYKSATLHLSYGGRAPRVTYAQRLHNIQTGLLREMTTFCLHSVIDDEISHLVWRMRVHLRLAAVIGSYNMESSEVNVAVLLKEETNVQKWGRGGVAVSPLASHQGEQGSPPNFRMRESCRTIPLPALYPALALRRCSILTLLTLVGTEDAQISSLSHNHSDPNTDELPPARRSRHRNETIGFRFANRARVGQEREFIRPGLHIALQITRPLSGDEMAAGCWRRGGGGVARYPFAPRLPGACGIASHPSTTPFNFFYSLPKPPHPLPSAPQCEGHWMTRKKRSSKKRQRKDGGAAIIPAGVVGGTSPQIHSGALKCLMPPVCGLMDAECIMHDLAYGWRSAGVLGRKVGSREIEGHSGLEENIRRRFLVLPCRSRSIGRTVVTPPPPVTLPGKELVLLTLLWVGKGDSVATPSSNPVRPACWHDHPSRQLTGGSGRQEKSLDISSTASSSETEQVAQRGCKMQGTFYHILVHVPPVRNVLEFSMHLTHSSLHSPDITPCRPFSQQTPRPPQPRKPPVVVRPLYRCPVAPNSLIPRIFLHIRYIHRRLQQVEGGAVTSARSRVMGRADRRCQSFLLPMVGGGRGEQAASSSA
ncbi:hypothetical protein PR048_025407 [Dryococelus australis]|uniref:Uncharacterized protein n=1 Tax=Dryococelus australis TaxID=614101 RepID=A0ABQ9GRC5_9NEOP|nr:hypothetical protein PR048_025407 [Dryococelus australis]